MSQRPRRSRRSWRTIVSTNTSPEPRQRGQATIVFTLRDGLIVRMQDYLGRADALAAIDRTSDGVWQ